jgi:hypothetical protein
MAAVRNPAHLGCDAAPGLGLPVEKQKKYWGMTNFSLDKFLNSVIFEVQSESVTLSVDYLISSAQTGTPCLGFSFGVDSH